MGRRDRAPGPQQTLPVRASSSGVLFIVDLCRLNIVVYRMVKEGEGQWRVQTLLFESSPSARTLRVVHIHGNHYDLVLAEEYFQKIIFCQQLVFETVAIAIKDTLPRSVAESFRNVPLELWRSARSCPHTMVLFQ